MTYYNAFSEDCSTALRKVTRTVTRRFDKELAHTGIRSTQFTVLVLISKCEALTMTEMANHLAMDRTTLTRNIFPLLKNGYIERAKLDDRRVRAYRLTKYGKEAVKSLGAVVDGFQKRVKHEFGEMSYSELMESLMTIMAIVSTL